MSAWQNDLAWLNKRVPVPRRKELRELSLYGLFLPFAFLPLWCGRRAAQLLARILTRRSSGYYRIMAGLMPGPIQQAMGRTEREAARRAEELLLFHKLVLMRTALVPWWTPHVRVEGIENLEAALAGGRGAILWVQPCLGSNITVKRALKEYGHPLVHLSRPGHPFSSTPFGLRFVNPLLRSPEVRFLRERVVISDESRVAPLRRLRACLRENSPVSITVTTDASTVNDVAFLDGSCRLPTGPIELARSAGAPLLPVFTVGTAVPPTVIIGSALPVRATADEEAVRHCQEEMVAWLEDLVRQFPADWLGWRFRLYRRP